MVRANTRSALDERALLAAWVKDRDRTALAELCRRRYDQAYGFALRVLGDPGSAADAATDAFVSLMRAARRFDASREFGPWWGAILVNSVRDAARRGRRRARHERAFTTERAETVEPEVVHRLEADEVARLVSELPLDVRLPLVLHFYEGQTHEEVARTLGCPKGTASSRIRRGLEQLRTALGASVASIASLETVLRTTARPSPASRPDVAKLELAARRATRLAFAKLGALAATASLALGLVLASELRRQESSSSSPASSVADAVVPEHPRTKDENPAPAGDAARASETPVTLASSGAAKTADAPATLGDGILVSVRDASGRPARWAGVALSTSQSEASFALRYRRRFRAGEDGTLLIPRAMLWKQPELSFAARLGLEEGASAPVRIAPSGIQRVDVALRRVAPAEKTCVLVVRATDGGRPIASAHVRLSGYVLLPSGTTKDMRDGAFTDESGRFALSLPAGEATLMVGPEGYAANRLVVSMGAGAMVEREVVCVRGATVTGHIIAPRGVDASDVGVTVWGDLVVGHQHEEVGKDGTYVIHDLAPGAYVIHGDRCPGCFTINVDLAVTGPGPVTGPDLSFGDGCRVVGRVLLPDGAPAGRATVSVQDGSRRYADTLTGPDGRFVIHGAALGKNQLGVDLPTPGAPEGTLTFISGGDASVDVMIDDPREKDLGDLSTEKKPVKRRVRGRVLDERGAPASGALVCAGSETATTDADGRFSVEGLEEGKAPFLLARRGAMVSAAVESAYDSEATLTLGAGGAIDGTVELAPGRDLPALNVSACYEEEAAGPWILECARAISAELDVNGAFKLEGLPAGKYEVRATGRIDASATVLVRLGETTRVRLVANATETVRVSVSGFGQDPTWTARTEWTRSDGTLVRTDAGERDPVLTTDAGRFPVELSVDAPGSVARGWRWLMKKTVSVEAGVPASLSFALPARETGGRIEGRAVFKGGNVWAVSESASLRVSVADDGTFVMEGLPPGRYLVAGIDGDPSCDRMEGAVAVTVEVGRTARVESAPRIEDR